MSGNASSVPGKAGCSSRTTPSDQAGVECHVASLGINKPLPQPSASGGLTSLGGEIYNVFTKFSTLVNAGEEQVKETRPQNQEMRISMNELNPLTGWGTTQSTFNPQAINLVLPFYIRNGLAPDESTQTLYTLCAALQQRYHMFRWPAPLDIRHLVMALEYIRAEHIMDPDDRENAWYKWIGAVELLRGRKKGTPFSSDEVGRLRDQGRFTPMEFFAQKARWDFALDRYANGILRVEMVDGIDEEGFSFPLREKIDWLGLDEE